MPQKPLSVPLFCQNLTTVILCYQAVQISFLTNCERSKILQQDLSSQLGNRNTSNSFFKNFTGYQSTQESITKSQPCATILSLKLTHSICLNFYCLLSIQTTSFYLRHKNLPHSSHKEKHFWRTSFFFHRPKTMEFIAI